MISKITLKRIWLTLIELSKIFLGTISLIGLSIGLAYVSVSIQLPESIKAYIVFGFLGFLIIGAIISLIKDIYKDTKYKVDDN